MKIVEARMNLLRQSSDFLTLGLMEKYGFQSPQ
jgi:hypothetical protein